MNFLQTHKRFAIGLSCVFFFVLGACAFPIYNLSREWPSTLTLSIIFKGVLTYTALGTAEASMLPKFKGWHILLLNIALILLSMGGRYLLEFGEVSNTYNFTIPNMLLHIGVTVTLSALSWLWVKTERSRNTKREA